MSPNTESQYYVFKYEGHAFKFHLVKTSGLNSQTAVLTSPLSLFSEFCPTAARSIFAIFAWDSKENVKVCGICTTL